MKGPNMGDTWKTNARRWRDLYLETTGRNHIPHTDQTVEAESQFRRLAESGGDDSRRASWFGVVTTIDERSFGPSEILTAQLELDAWRIDDEGGDPPPLPRVGQRYGLAPDPEDTDT